MKKKAYEHKLFISGGSDYHGKNKDIPLAKLNTDSERVVLKEITIIDKLKKRRGLEIVKKSL